MNIKNVKQSTIFAIALLVSVLINLPRFLELYDVVGGLGASFTSATIIDIVIRILFLFTYSWIALQFNTNWKHRFFNFGKSLNTIFVILTNAILFFITVLSFIFIHQKFADDLMNSSDKGLLYFVYFIILVILIFISRILRFQITHQEDIAEKELLKRQSLQNELSALKNQINPHFLFNSLNSLNSLIRGNEQATTFVNKLSYMYRYILQSGQQDLVTLDEELKFLNSYIYLIKTRYRDRFSIKIDINDIYLNQDIPTLTLQLLVENAIKHNEISEEKPLEVSIYIEKDELVVENKIQPRLTFVDSTGQGLANIDKRYTLLKEKQIKISNANNMFRVKLPLN
ncbi:MAG: histidine kinase [Psychroserpens sp.]|uniref:sensor histidine kinase n=1 Tax=Psychroserpens sp. TaxID=2020870 RepID=UPI0030029889